jgi:hypothetical protein
MIYFTFNKCTYKEYKDIINYHQLTWDKRDLAFSIWPSMIFFSWKKIKKINLNVVIKASKPINLHQFFFVIFFDVRVSSALKTNMTVRVRQITYPWKSSSRGLSLYFSLKWLNFPILEQCIVDYIHKYFITSLIISYWHTCQNERKRNTEPITSWKVRVTYRWLSSTRCLTLHPSLYWSHVL